MGVKFDLVLVVRSQFFDYFCEFLYERALKHLEAAGQGKNESFTFLPTVNAYQYLTSLKVCDWSEHVFDAGASTRSVTQKLAISSSSTVYGGQNDTKHVAFELLMHAAFAADEMGFYA